MKKILILLLFLCSSFAFAQKVLKGKVIDINGTLLQGANIIILGTDIGTASNEKGEFVLTDLPNEIFELQISMIGYKKQIRKINPARIPALITIQLTSTEIRVGEVVVSASKYEQRTIDLPVSAEVMTADFLSKKNIVQLDEALRYVPGVNITLDQISIRGSSGYSRGAGTRVLTAIDGIPIYSGDTGEIIWQLVPVSEVSRVEVIKGAASSLYGSTALGGIINVVTKENSSTPVTFVRGYFGFYDKPYYSEWDWSGERRTFNGMTVSHSNSFNDFGYSFSLARDENRSYRQGDWIKRYSGYFKGSYKFSDKSRLSFLGLGITQRRGTFNFWKDSGNALVPPDDDQGEVVSSDRLIAGVNYTNQISADWVLKVITNINYSNWKDESESANNSESSLLRTEIQSSHNFDNGLHLIYGIELARGVVTSNIFGNPTSSVLGGYFQTEYKFNFPLTLTLGARYDVTNLDTLDAFKDFSPKIGLNYKLTNDLILRSSFGKGFRAPSLAEAFTATNTSGILVKPNPNLQPERSYSFEIGLKKIIPDFAEFDAAFFSSDYYEMIEPTIDPADGKVFFENLTRAKIQGGEFGIRFELPVIYSNFNAGYTYLWARDINNNKALKYRPRHILYSSFTIAPSFYQIGVDFRYWSRVEEIDNELVELGLVKDGDRRVEVFVVDLRAGASLYGFNLPLNVYINVNNLLNYNYVEMIGNVSPIRNISINLELLF